MVNRLPNRNEKPVQVTQQPKLNDNINDEKLNSNQSTKIKKLDDKSIWTVPLTLEDTRKIEDGKFEHQHSYDIIRNMTFPNLPI